MIYYPDQIKPFLEKALKENRLFKIYLRKYSSAKVDKYVSQFYDLIAPQIDCTKCANCCKILYPPFQPSDLDIVSKFLNRNLDELKSDFNYDENGMYYAKQKPCALLNDNKCAAYSIRPLSCQDFPHLKQKGFRFKKNVWENYQICPIIFNVVEMLKKKTGFISIAS